MKDIDELVTAIDDLEKAFLVEMEKLVNEHSQKTRNTAVELCPVDKGRLRASIDIDKVEQYMHDIGTNVEYAEHVEFGTATQGAQPYLVPALIKGIKDLKTASRKKMNALVKEFVR